MLFEPMILVEQPLRVAAVVAIILLGKSMAAFALVVLLRYPASTALMVSASLAQIGEFSFILAALGISLGLLPHEGQSLILAGAILSIALNPLMFMLGAPLERLLGKKNAGGTIRAQCRSAGGTANVDRTGQAGGPSGARWLWPRGAEHRGITGGPRHPLRGGGTES
jgi:hypothetical protein